MFNHFWFNTGYVELNYGLWPIHAKDAFSGPFTASKSAPTVLEVATTYDPATPTAVPSGSRRSSATCAS